MSMTVSKKELEQELQRMKKEWDMLDMTSPIMAICATELSERMQVVERAINKMTMRDDKCQ